MGEKFLPGNNVRLIAINAEGFIEAVEERYGAAVMYKVIYWLDGKRLDVWVYDFEISKFK